jgi:Fe-S-cluster containining protein
MITDLVQIKRLGEKKREENSKFRVFLKTHDHNEKRFRRIGEEIEDQIDCTVCANCCKVASVQVSDRDVARLAKSLRITPQKFIAEYTVLNEKENTRDLRRTESGCVFLSGNDCTVYDDRPTICRDFPHVVRGEGRTHTRMWQFIDRACYCPIVYNALEAYKEEAGFRLKS